jgi:hypothetical protein
LTRQQANEGGVEAVLRRLTLAILSQPAGASPIRISGELLAGLFQPSDAVPIRPGWITAGARTADRDVIAQLLGDGA